MQANYELRADDLQALVDLLKPGGISPKTKLIAMAAIYVALVGYAFNKLPLNVALTALLPGVLFTITMVRAIRMMAPSRELAKNNFCGECDLKIEFDGLTERRASGELKRHWSAIDRLVKTNTHLFIYATGLIAFVLPKRAFTNDAEFNRFVKAIEDRSSVKVISA